MKRYLPFLFILLMAACGQTEKKTNAETTAKTKSLSRNFQEDLNTLLPSGEFTVDIMDKIKMSPRRQELFDKFMQAAKNNADWFMEQQQYVEKTGQEPPYDARFGMSEPEWNEYKAMMKDMNDMEAESSGTEGLTVSNVAGIITFKAAGRLDYLNYTSINLHKKEIYIFEHTLALIDTICVKNDKNIFKTAWRGYEFQYSDEANRAIPKNKKELENIKMKFYTFTLGLFPKTGKTYIEISGTETENGKDLVKFKIPFVIN